MSADGDLVAFTSDSDAIVAGDTNGRRDVFVRSIRRGTTGRVSVSSGGEQANGASFDPHLSDDGTRVSFTSEATNLAAGATNGVSTVLLHDLSSRTTTAVIRGRDGGPPNQRVLGGHLSGNGTVLLFYASATNLVPGPTGRATETFALEVTPTP